MPCEQKNINSASNIDTVANCITGNQQNGCDAIGAFTIDDDSNNHKESMSNNQTDVNSSKKDSSNCNNSVTDVLLNAIKMNDVKEIYCEDTLKKEIDELVALQEGGFTIKIISQNSEPLELQVSSTEIVQELHQILIDREESSHRTCFTLQLDGVVLDNYTELKSIPNLKEGSVLRVVEEPYTMREARIHVRHIRDLLKSAELFDAYNGIDGASLSFLNVILQSDSYEKKRGRSNTASITDTYDILPPSYIMPNKGEVPLLPLHPLPSKDNNKFIQCLKVLTTSGWNPPPGHRKLRGDLLYVYTHTLEDKRFHITACPRGFYLNKCTDDIFNPESAEPNYLSHSLVDLLSSISPLFKKNYALMQKKRQQKLPIERISTPYQLYSWVSPQIEHTVDSIRAEETKLGYEEQIPGQSREWNEELQATREMPCDTILNRINRERAVFKVNSDFIAAATRGAMAVIDGNVMPINPGEDSRMQMFLWNGIFFSLGFDVHNHYQQLGGDIAAFIAPKNDLLGVKLLNAFDLKNLFTLGTVVIDYRGFRVTAQSIIPGILDKEQERSVIYGSIDFGKTIRSHPKYLEIMKKLSDQLKILPHKLIDAKGESVELCSSVECKGILGNDGRYYILDLLRMFPPDPNFLILENDELSPKMQSYGFPIDHKHKLCVLRQELINFYVENRYLLFLNYTTPGFSLLNGNGIVNGNKNVDQLDNEDSKDLIKRTAYAVGSLIDDGFDIRFNPDIYSNGIIHDTKSGPPLEKQRRIVKDAAEFLVTIQIPSFVRDCLDHNSAPMDGPSLSEILHIKGINIRYLGKVCDLLKKFSQLNYLYKLTIVELILRSTKHIYRTYIQVLIRKIANVSQINLANAIAHFLNCFLHCGFSVNAQPNSEDTKNGKKKSKRLKYKSHLPSETSMDWISLTSKSLWSQIKQEMKAYFDYNFDCSSINEVIETYSLSRISMLRSFCNKVGIQLLIREYNFDSKSKLCFSDEDILNVFPIVKHVTPRATDAVSFYTTGQSKIQEGYLKEGYELIMEALNLLNQVYGPMHPEIVQCLRLIARLNYLMEDYLDAVSYQQKAVLMSERVNGIDHPTTITDYVHLALYCFASNQIVIALQLLYRARYLTLLVCGENHPEIALIDSTISLILHVIGEHEVSLKFLEKSLELNMRHYGRKSLKVALIYHLIARTKSCVADFRMALCNEKEAYTIYKAQFGENHEKTKESAECLKHLTQQAVVMQRKINDMNTGKCHLSLPPIQIQSPSMSSILDTLNIIHGIIFVTISTQDLEYLKSEFEKQKIETDSTK